PPVPTKLYGIRHFGLGGPPCASQSCIPEGFDSSGHLLDYLDLSSAFALVVRYDTHTHRFLPGWEPAAEMGRMFPSPLGDEWEIEGQMDFLLPVRVRFPRADCARQCRYDFLSAKPRPRYGEINDLTIDRRGNAWIAGWNTQYPGWDSVAKQHQPGLPLDIPRGRSVVYYATDTSTHLKKIFVPAPAPVTGITVAPNGLIWLTDPYHYCLVRGGRRRCSPPMLLSYDPATRTFNKYAMPRGVLPHLCMHIFVTKCNTYLSTPMTVARDGSLWIAVPARGSDYYSPQVVRLIHFRSGAFTSYRLALNPSPLTRPIIGRSGNVWLTGRNGHPIVFQPSSGKRFCLREHGGYLVQDHHSRIWYVFAASKRSGG
ncbi:MAG TPA: hypothetical protein VG815_17775, partial [Chloroflexota bacterium]|nr:hypothetical protein [Chloroflexota bacterium]